MTDKEAIEALTDKDVVNPYLTLEALEIAIDALKERAERKKKEKTGKWILWEDCEGKTRTCTCPFCGDETRCWKAPKYCGNCGAKMEVDE